ncbi:MAG: response regulator [Thermodesulfobacteriota bacterium]
MGKYKILIGESQAIVALDFKARLERMGYEVCGVFGNGREAVAGAEDLRPDLVLLDLDLCGEMDSVEAGRRLGARLKVPVIYLTTFTGQNQVDPDRLDQAVWMVGKMLVSDNELSSTMSLALTEGPGGPRGSA